MMTTDIERQFFDTFEIEPHKVYPPQDELFGTREEMIEFFEEEYPQITDRILLELICIANHEDVYIDLEGTDIETMKNNLLENFIFFRRDVKKYVQELFKEHDLCN